MENSIVKVKKRNTEAMTLPAVIDSSKVFSERALAHITRKEKELQQIETSETAIAMKIERLKARIAKTDEAKELAELLKRYKHVKGITKDMRRSIAVTMEDDLSEVPGKFLYDKIKFLTEGQR